MDFGAVLTPGITACSGAEIYIRTDGDFDIRLVQLSLQKKLIYIDKKEEFTGSPLNALPVKGPLAITLTGRGVLIKKTAKIESITEQSLRNLMPNFKLEEFYLQHFQSGEHSFISFIRKEIADPVIAALKKQGTELLLFSLGPFVADQVIPQLNNYGTALYFGGHQVTLNPAKDWIDYSYVPDAAPGFDLKIDIEPIPEQFLLAYASAFQLMLSERLELVAVDSPQIQHQLVEHTAKLKFNRNSMLVLVFFFTVLLFNFLLFSFYNSANQALAGKVGQRSDVYADRQRLEAELKEKETLVNNLGWNHGMHYAYLCDQIGRTLPATISLTELSINSFKDNITGSAKKGLLETGSMKITGQSASVYIINDWIYALKQKSWVKAVQLEKYATDDQKGTQVFTLLLNY